MHVYILDADIRTDSGNYDGITRTHASEAGAIAALEEFLRGNDVDIDAARYGEVRTSTSLCNDPDPDILDGVIVTYSINRLKVQP